MKDTTLVIMAAGIGSRFGGGIKQLEPMGPNGEIIMDYSIYDAKAAGFNKVVFILRKDIEADFREIIGQRIEKVIDVDYVFQSLDDLPAGYTAPADRKKPWGTGQAVLCCKGVVNEPFAVINADDYYGKEAFKKVHDYLVGEGTTDKEYDMCMAGFILKNTLSDNGAVTRGVCVVDENEYLTAVVETGGIMMTPEGTIIHEENGSDMAITPEQHVSMNMWGFTPNFLNELETGFEAFLSEIPEGEVKREYLLPTIVDKLIKSGKASVKVLETKDKWFGVTYKEDKESVVAAFKKLIADGVYPENLWG
ncbi:nucleotidyltransferase [Frisingicoccus sp.]|uniref:nucleotidyltransferase n=1 Tax=Frisingicoccus sp. TaxID=1918627 RepID=UPI00302F2D77